MSRGAEVPAVVRAAYDATASVLRNSVSGRVTIARLGGVLDPDLLEPGARRRLEETIARTCQPIGIRDVERELREAWNQKPGEILDELDPEPLAVHSAAQVHRGVLDGEPVAVKVRRPGMERTAHTDLALLDTVAPALGRVLGAVDTKALLLEARERILDEMDFEYEAQGQRQAGRALRDVEGVRVPAVHTELCAPAVLVSELLEGPTLADPAAVVPDPEALARKLVEVHLGLVLRARSAPCDPRPSHVVLCPDGSIGLLGLGVARPVHPPRQQRLLEALLAMRAGDEAAFGEAIGRLGLLPAADAGTAMELVNRVLGQIVLGPARLDGSALSDFADRGLEAIDELADLAGRVTLEPADLWPLRGLVQLAIVLARLEATQDWVQLAVDAGRER